MYMKVYHRSTDNEVQALLSINAEDEKQNELENGNMNEKVYTKTSCKLHELNLADHLGNSARKNLKN